MEYGDLGERDFAAVLADVAARSFTGCLQVGEASVYLRDGGVCGVGLGAPRPDLGERLVSSGSLGPEGLAQARDLQTGPLPAGGIAALLAHLGYVDRTIVDALISEQVLDVCADLLRRPAVSCQLHAGALPTEALTAALSVVDLLSQVRERDRVWARLVDLVPSPGAVPVLSAAGLAASPVNVPGEAWAVLCKVDGQRSVAELAGPCGFTRFEATHLIAKLVHGGLLLIASRPAKAPAAEEPMAEPLVELAAWQDPTESLLAAALLAELSRNDVPDRLPAPVALAEPEPEPSPAVDVPVPRPDTDTASLMRELSFLGVDEPAGAPPRSAPATRPHPSATPRKRKGLFGR